MDDKDKILCGCGVVFFSPASEEGGKWILLEACPGCDRKDNSPEILSIEKISRKRAAAIIRTVCDLLESEAVHALDGQVERRVRELAQHLEDLGRPTAAARIVKGWSVLKGGMVEGATSVLQGQSAVRQPAKGKKVQFVGLAVPGCLLCGAAVMDHEKHRNTADELVCPKCRTAPTEPRFVAAFEAEVTRQEAVLDSIGRRCASLKSRLEEMKVARKDK